MVVFGLVYFPGWAGGELIEMIVIHKYQRVQTMNCIPYLPGKVVENLSSTGQGH